MRRLEIKPEQPKVVHKDTRRTLTEIFNGGFNIRQIKVLEVNNLSERESLGGHFHDYRELFYILRGEADYAFRRAHTTDRVDIHLNAGELVKIPEGTMHYVTNAAKGTLMIGIAEKEYLSDAISHPTDGRDINGNLIQERKVE